MPKAERTNAVFPLLSLQPALQLRIGFWITSMGYGTGNPTDRRNESLGLAILGCWVLVAAGCRTQTSTVTDGRTAAVEKAKGVVEARFALQPLDGAATEPARPEPLPALEEPKGGIGSSRPLEAEIELWIWLAGRPRLAGLPAVRQSERDRERAGALKELADDIERRGRRRSPVLNHIRELFQSPKTTNELWSSCAIVAADLALYECAEFIASPWLNGMEGTRHLASAVALHRLFGRWFTDAEELVPYLQNVRAGVDTELFLESLAQHETRSRRRLFALLEQDPVRAQAWLGDRDPVVRAGAARILGLAFALEGVDSKAVFGVLLDMLEKENEPHAFHEGLEAVVVPMEYVDVRAPELERLRDLLARVTTSGDDARAMSAVGVIARLPWSTGVDRDAAHLLSAIALVGEALQDLADAERRRGAFDPDPLVRAFQALEVLSHRAVKDGLAEDLRGSPVRRPVVSILSDPSLDSAVRSMAASALGPLALRTDTPLFVSVLRESVKDPAVAHALLGATRELLLTLSPTAPEVVDILAAVADLSGATDPDLRRRALLLLADEGLAQHVTGLDWGFLVDRIAREEIADLDRTLLALIRRYGKYHLEPLLDVKRLPGLATETGSLAELALTLGTLADGRPHLTMLAARWLAGVGTTETLHAARQHALTMVAGLGESARQGLTPDDHRSVCTWAWQLHEAGIRLEDTMPQGEVFIERLAAIHIPRALRAEEVGELPTAALEHLKALVEAYRYVEGGQQGAKGTIERSFQQAFELTADTALRRLVLRDRARFRSAVGENEGALLDFRALLEAGALQVPDLRIAIGILQAGEDGAPGDPAVIREVCRLYGTLVGLEFWIKEPQKVRLQDLDDWGKIAIASKEKELLEAVLSTLADLPRAQPDEGIVYGEDPPVWAGLLRDPQGFQALTDLRARVAGEIASLDLNN